MWKCVALLLVFTNSVKQFSCIPVPIVGGGLAEPGQYNFTVSLQVRITNKDGGSYYRHFCGGELIRDRWILTAAHCLIHQQVNDFNGVIAVIGRHDLSKTSSGHVFKLKKVIFGDFVGTTFYNDIALAKLDAYAHQMRSIISPLRLPTHNDTIPDDYCMIHGYGATQSGGNSSRILKAGRVRVISLLKCENKLGRVVAPSVGSKMICAEGGTVDSCQGDSGSGLICGDTIFGLTSYGMGCGNSGVPGVYTSVLDHLDWILDVIAREK